MGRGEVLFKCCYFPSDASCISNNPLNTSHLPSRLVVPLSFRKQAEVKSGRWKSAVCHVTRQGRHSLDARLGPLRWCLGILHIIEVSTTEFMQVMSCVHVLLQRFGAPRRPATYKRASSSNWHRTPPEVPSHHNHKVNCKVNVFLKGIQREHWVGVAAASTKKLLPLAWTTNTWLYSNLLHNL